MTVTECYVGMKTSLPMEYDGQEKKSNKPRMAKATCIWIHPRGIYAVFQLETGIRTTIYLDDEKRWAKNTPEPRKTTEQERVVPELCENNARIKAAVKEKEVTYTVVSRKAGKSATYLPNRLRWHVMDDDETSYWLDLIDTVADWKNMPLDPHDPHYLILSALKDTGLTPTRASKLCGHYGGWLSGRLNHPCKIETQREIADAIRKRAAENRWGRQEPST